MNLIFDFDGTIADSFQTMIHQFNQLAPQYHYKQINKKDEQSLHNLSSKEIIKHLKIPVHYIPMIINKIRKSLFSEIKNIPSFPFLPNVIETLYQSGCTLGIVTSNSKNNVTTWLEYHQLMPYFKFIHVENNFFGKARVLDKLIKKYKIDKRNAFYIGDETRDIEAAKKIKIYSIAVTWGFTREDVLLKSEPHFIANTPEDILKIIVSSAKIKQN